VQGGSGNKDELRQMKELTERERETVMDETRERHERKDEEVKENLMTRTGLSRTQERKNRYLMGKVGKYLYSNVVLTCTDVRR